MPRHIFNDLFKSVDGVTWYVQAILNRPYRLDAGVITSDTVREAIGRILISEQEDYKRLYHLLTANQSRLLLAIAREGCVKEPMAGLFLRTHNLKSASSVQRSLLYLLDKEYVYRADDGYIVYDRFLGMWMKNAL